MQIKDLMINKNNISKMKTFKKRKGLRELFLKKIFYYHNAHHLDQKIIIFELQRS